MKNLFFMISILTLVVGCDAPQRTRAPIYVNGNGYTSTAGTTSGFTGTTSGSSSGTTTTGSNGLTSTPGFESCNINLNRYQNMAIGAFDICQSTQDETAFLFRTSLGSSSSRTCLIPTYKDSTGSSTYIGNPQCALTEANKAITGRLYKDRSGFTSLPLNGVIVMPENLTPEYISCMQGYTNWPSNACQTGHVSCNYRYQCPYGGGNSVGTLCDSQARNYMAEVCNSFKSKYANSYSDIRTK